MGNHGASTGAADASAALVRELEDNEDGDDATASHGREDGAGAGVLGLTWRPADEGGEDGADTGCARRASEVFAEDAGGWRRGQGRTGAAQRDGRCCGRQGAGGFCGSA